MNSYEHDQKGITTEKSEDIKKMIDKRFAKIKSIEEDMCERETIKVNGDKTSENVVVFFGSNNSDFIDDSHYLYVLLVRVSFNIIYSRVMVGLEFV